MDIPQEKICTACLVSKPLKDFRNDKYRPDGKSSKCRLCKRKRDKEIYDEHPGRGAANTAAWREKNPDKVTVYAEVHREHKNQRRRERYALNPARELAVNAAWYAAHKPERAITMAAWETANKITRKKQRAARYLENPEKHRAARKAWDEAHPGYGAVKWQRRSSRQSGAEIVDLSPEQWDEVKAAFGFRCAYCPANCKACRNKTHDLHQEHITPVSKGGNYTLHNIVPSCQHCNSRKGTGDPLRPVQPLLLTTATPHIPRKRRKAS